MPNLTEDRLKEVLEEILLNKEHLCNDIHLAPEEYEWVVTQIKLQKARIHTLKKIQEFTIQWTVTAILSGLLYWVSKGHWPPFIN